MSNVGYARRKARECALQFLYQSEREKTYYFQESSFDDFCNNFNTELAAREYAKQLARGVFDRQTEIDQLIGAAAQNWSIDRFGSTDRCVLRMAVYELLTGEVPYKAVLNEAIELAKIFGTENSGKFVNGLLDKIAKERDIK